MISDLLKNLTAKEKANIKAKEIAKLNFVKYTDTQTGIEVEIQNGKITPIDGGIELYARAWKGVNQLGLGKDGKTEWERFRIFNPPILVNDPNGTIVRTWEDATTKEIKTRKLREDPIEAIRQSLAHTIKVSSKEGANIIKGSFGNTTSTFYPDAGTGGTTVDGYARRWTGAGLESWATIVAGAGTSAADTDANIQVIYVIAHDAPNTDKWRGLYRSIYTFNTAAIPDTDNISAAVMSIQGTAKADDNGQTPNIDIYTSSPANNNAVVMGDYSQVQGTSQTGSPITYANWSTTAYNDFTFNATGIGNILKTGISRFGARNANYDVANSAPAWTNAQQMYLSGYFADQAGTANDPKLVVVHAASSAIKTINGLAKASVKTVNGLAIASVKTWDGLA